NLYIACWLKPVFRVFFRKTSKKHISMKAIIPVAGMGSRLRPHTHTQPKALVPVAGKAILGHIIDRLRQAGVEEFVFIIGYLGDKIEAYVKRLYPDLKAWFVVQEPREGIAHALWVARDYFRHDDSMVIMLGDTIVDVDLQKLLQSPNSVLAVKKVTTPSLFGVAEADESGVITKVVEKPRIPKSNFALVGLYKINDPEKLVQALEFIIKSELRTQNEFQLTDALMQLIKQGEKMTIQRVDNWFDCGRKESLLEANAILLNRPDFAGNSSQANYPNAIIIPPVSIGQNCNISNSIIGPNVAIGENSHIHHSIISDSIIGSYSEISHGVLHHSIMGSDASFKGLSHSLNIGDNTEINFSL
ncbi:MAG: NTP transferase domain-containing protein, partial [Hymenobacteraceae bacterium]|nr:NTP transferase domain-containing protein [Hymenobacteraceae bacterium]